MIPNSTVISFVVAAIFTLLAPIAIIIVLAVKKRINGLPLLFGALAFSLSQVVLRIPLLSFLSGQEWFIRFQILYYIPFILLISLSAGLFEESARLGGALLLKKRRSFKDIISFGLGHGLCEVILLVGFSHLSNTILCLTINSDAGVNTTAIPAQMIEMAVFQLAAVNPVHVYLGIMERFSAVLFHIFATVLVFKGVIDKKKRYYVIAIAAHTMFNFIGIVLTQYAGVYIGEAAILLMGLSAGGYVLKYKNTQTQPRKQKYEQDY